MTLWFPREDLPFHELEESPVGRFKLWVHYAFLRAWVYPLLPLPVRRPVYQMVRRWLFGPNANLEDLQAVLQEATAKVRAIGAK